MSLEIKNLKKSFADLSIFSDLNIEIENRKITCILGPSGIGKTTLLNILSGITEADSGQLADFKERTISYIFQEPRLLEWKTVRENISFPLRGRYSNTDIDGIAEKYIKIVGLEDFKDHYPGSLSGGMKQRVSIARAFAYPSDILIMDEPFKSLDFKLKKSLLLSFLKLWEIDNRTVLFVTHDIEEAASLGDFIFILGNKLPASVKDILNIKVPQHDRLNDYHEIAKIKNRIMNLLN